MFRIDNVLHRIRKRKWHNKYFHWKYCISWNYVIVLTNRSANALDNNKRNRFILRARSFLILRFPRRLKIDKDVDQQVWSVRSFSFIFPNWLVVIHPSLLLIQCLTSSPANFAWNFQIHFSLELLGGFEQN